MVSFLFGSRLIPTVALILSPSIESFTTIVNFLIRLLFERRLILLYNTEELIFKFLLNCGTDVLASRVSSVRIFISSSSNLCKLSSEYGYRSRLINVIILNQLNLKYSLFSKIFCNVQVIY